LWGFSYLEGNFIEKKDFKYYASIVS
jgi:hypothetical protein